MATKWQRAGTSPAPAIIRAVSVATRKDVRRQKRLDSRHGHHQAALDARIAAVAGARQALARREPAAEYALRQSLIDLAAAAELVAEDLPRPVIESRSARIISASRRA